MGHTNSTANLSLPQFIGTDKPTWLGDVNGAFLAIDSYVGTNDAAVAAAASDASSAISQAGAAVNTANTANTTAGNASTAANNAVGVANTANAIAGAVDTKVGLLANLNTVDKTNLVNAINEVLTDGIYEIWKNTNPASFAAQTITFPDADYDTFLVEAGSAGRGELVVMFEKGEDALITQTQVRASDGTVQMIMRSISSSVASGTVSLAFTDADNYIITSYGTAPTPITANSNVVPIRIFGIKHQ